jgi:hypothetical protein
MMHNNMPPIHTETISSDLWQQPYDSVHAGRITARKFHSENRRHSEASVMTSSPRDVIFSRVSNADSSAVGPALTLELLKQHNKSTAATLLDGEASKPHKKLKPKRRQSEDMQKTGKMSELQMRRFTLFFFAS